MAKIIRVKNLIEEPPKLYVSSGNVLLNCALSGKADGGWGAGKMVNIIGDSSAGKTVVALTAFAEICRDPRFDHYDLIFDDVEESLEFDIERMFNKKMAKRIKYRSSETIEDYYGGMVSQINTGNPFAWILDSFDALTSREEQKRAAEFAKQEEKRLKGLCEPELPVEDKESKKGKKEKGSYKTEKPKTASEIFRVTTSGIKKTESFSFVISQTRDNIGFGAMFAPRTRSGGRALKFYATHELWLSVGEKHEKAGLTIGSDCMVKVSKNKLTGKKRSVYFPIYEEYGVDSIESGITYLLDQKHWEMKPRTKTEKAGINTPDFGIPRMKIDEMVHYIEDNNLEPELNSIIQAVWDETEEKAKLNRKPKYG